jgi:hypothetical protein
MKSSKFVIAYAVSIGSCCLVVPAEAAETIRPSADGTLVDGGNFGPFDGSPDAWDWTFNDSSYEGAISLSTASPQSSIEHRVVWEYDLTSVANRKLPVSAELFFTLRGAPIFPFPDVDVFVYAYPADLEETPDDYASGPAVLQGGARVFPFQEPTEYSLDVSGAVNQALQTGEDKVAFRFQINPATPNQSNQAFMDAADSDPTTKPYLIIDRAVPKPADLDFKVPSEPDSPFP